MNKEDLIARKIWKYALSDISGISPTTKASMRISKPGGISSSAEVCISLVVSVVDHGDPRTKTFKTSNSVIGEYVYKDTSDDFRFLRWVALMQIEQKYVPGGSNTVYSDRCIDEALSIKYLIAEKLRNEEWCEKARAAVQSEMLKSSFKSVKKSKQPMVAL